MYGEPVLRNLLSVSTQCSLVDSFIIDTTVMEKSSQCADQRKKSGKEEEGDHTLYFFSPIQRSSFKVKKSERFKYLVRSTTESMNTKSRNMDQEKRKIFAMAKRS